MQFSRTAQKSSQKIHRAHLRSLQVKAFLPGLHRARPPAVFPASYLSRWLSGHLVLTWALGGCTCCVLQVRDTSTSQGHQWWCLPTTRAGQSLWKEVLPTCSLWLSWMEEGMTKTEPLVFQQEQNRPRRQKPGGLFIPLLSQTSIY